MRKSLGVIPRFAAASQNAEAFLDSLQQLRHTLHIGQEIRILKNFTVCDFFLKPGLFRSIRDLEGDLSIHVLSYAQRTGRGPDDGDFCCERNRSPENLP